MVWRSLAPYRDKGLRYDYMDAYRFVDIYFDRDTTYNFLRLLADLDLLVLAIGLADLPNKLLPQLIIQVLTLRQDAGRPTWVFVPYTRAKVAETYGMAVADVLGDVKPVVEGLPSGLIGSIVSPTMNPLKPVFKPRS